MDKIVESLAAAIPATIAALAAWRASSRVNKKVSTNNGKTIGQMVEYNHEFTKVIAGRLDDHIDSDDAHAE